MTKTFKDVNLSSIPAPVADLLRCLIPEDADVEIIYADVARNADAVKDDCTPMGCADCSDCPINRAVTVNLLKTVAAITNAYTKLVSLVRLNGDVLPNDRQAAIDALGVIINEGDYASALLEGDVNV